MNSLVLNRKMRSVASSQNFGLAGWFSKYRIKKESSLCERHMSMLVLLTPSLWKFSMFFESVASLVILFSSISGLI